MLIKCIYKLLLNDKESRMIKLFFDGDILSKLSNFIDPSNDRKLLIYISKIYKIFCELSHSQLSDSNKSIIVTEEHQKNIIKQLHIMICYEDDDNEILCNILKSFCLLIGDECNLSELDKIINNDDFVSVIKDKYFYKTKQNKLLFTGFIKKIISKCDYLYIPNDIKWLLFKYYNCYNYNNIKYDLLKRLVYLQDINNNYSTEIQNNAIYTIAKITQFCSADISNKFLKYNLLTKWIKGMNTYNIMIISNMNNICWIIGNLAFDNFDNVWKSNIIKLLINYLQYEWIGNQIINGLFNIIQLNQMNVDKLNIIIDEYEFIENLSEFMKNNNKNASMDISFDIIEYLLDNDNISSICKSKLVKYDILKLLIEIKGYIVFYDENIRLRAISIIGDHFPNSNDYITDSDILLLDQQTPHTDSDPQSLILNIDYSD